MTADELVPLVAAGFRRVIQILKTVAFRPADRAALAALGTQVALPVTAVTNGTVITHAYNTRLVELLQARNAAGEVQEGIAIRPLSASTFVVIMPDADDAGEGLILTGKLILRHRPDIA